MGTVGYLVGEPGYEARYIVYNIMNHVGIIFDRCERIASFSSSLPNA